MSSSEVKTEAKAKKPVLNVPEVLSAGNLDARYIKLLRRRGDEDLAFHYDRNRTRFKMEDVQPVPIWEVHPGSSAYQGSDQVDSLSHPETSMGRRSSRQRLQWGSASRNILQPEGPDRRQPLMLKKGRSGDEAMGESWGHDAYSSRDAYVEHAMRDFIVYIIFLVIANMITFGVLDHAYNYYANVLSEILTETKFNTSLGRYKTFNEIRTVQQIWDFINKVLLKVLYEYGSDHTRSIKTTSKGILVLFENILIGVPRIRQQRVRNDSCKVEHIFQDLFSTCYNYYSDDQEDKSPFGIMLPTTWTYAEPDKDSAKYNGKISSYGGGGYMMNITGEVQFTKKWVQELMQHNWLREGSRVVFIDFTTYTPNTNLFCVVKLVFELPPSGGVIPSSHFYTMKFLRYVNTWDHFVLGCEIVFLCYIVYFTMEEVQQMIILKEEYWYSSWNFLDVLILLVAYFVVISACIRYVTISGAMKDKVNHIESQTHASFDNFVHVQRMFNASSSLLSFLVWLKLLKFAALNKNVALILSIFGRVKFELIALTLMMFTMVVGFALLGNMLFGTHVEQFNTIWNSIFSLVGITVGGLYFYTHCANASPYLAPIYFVMYIFIVLVLFLNAYVALIVHGFHKTVEEFEDQKDRVYLKDICRTLLYKTLRFFRKNDLATKLRNKAISKGNKKEYDELLKIVKKHGYRGLDLTMIMKKHNIISGAPIPFDRMSQLFNEIDAKNQLVLEVEEHDKIMDQVNKISQKVEALDQSIADVSTKVDTLVKRLLYDEAK